MAEVKKKHQERGRLVVRSHEKRVTERAVGRVSQQRVSFFHGLASASARKAAQASCTQRDELDIFELGSKLSYLVGTAAS